MTLASAVNRGTGKSYLVPIQDLGDTNKKSKLREEPVRCVREDHAMHRIVCSQYLARQELLAIISAAAHVAG